VVAQVLAGDELKTIVALEVAAAVEALPIQYGKDGRDGKDGERGPQGERGEKGDTGADGIGQAGAMIDREGCLIITTTKGEAVKLGCVVGRDGKDGANGMDGLSVESLEREYLPESHEIVERWTAVGRMKEMRYPAGGVHDGGYWSEGKRAIAGRAYTCDGHLWIAVRDNASKPCLENKADWRLAVRRGRDGLDGKNGRDLGPAPPVKLGGGNA
jgi:hypothetical protein